MRLRLENCFRWELFSSFDAQKKVLQRIRLLKWNWKGGYALKVKWNTRIEQIFFSSKNFKISVPGTVLCTYFKEYLCKCFVFRLRAPQRNVQEEHFYIEPGDTVRYGIRHNNRFNTTQFLCVVHILQRFATDVGHKVADFLYLSCSRCLSVSCTHKILKTYTTMMMMMILVLSILISASTAVVVLFFFFFFLLLKFRFVSAIFRGSCSLLPFV